MKQHKTWLFAACSLLILATYLWLLPASEKQPGQADSRNQETRTAFEESNHVKVTDTQPPILKAVAPASEQEIRMTQAVKQQMQDIAVAYETNMRFPSYSMPLSHKDWTLLNPRPFIKKTIPLDVNENLSASIILKHYVVHRDEDLAVEVQITGAEAQNLSIQSASAYLLNDKNLENAIKLAWASTKGETLVYSGTLSAKAFDGIDNTEHHVVADIVFSDHQQARVSTVFKLVGTDATLTGLGESYVDGAHLMIPATFDVRVPGYYRVQANLFDQASNSPVSHINSAFTLTTSDNTSVLKVHAVTLRSQGFAGPYTLKDINITRGPAHPGDQTGYGASKEASYTIQGHDLEVYDDTEYVDPKNQQRLEFLQRMAGVE